MHKKKDLYGEPPHLKLSDPQDPAIKREEEPEDSLPWAEIIFEPDQAIPPDKKTSSTEKSGGSISRELAPSEITTDKITPRLGYSSPIIITDEALEFLKPTSDLEENSPIQGLPPLSALILVGLAILVLVLVT